MNTEVKNKPIRQSIIDALCSPKIFFYTCLWLFVLVFVGTLAQGDIGDSKGIGLYAAQAKYFSSWFIWLHDFPVLPAGRLTMAVVFFNLLFKFVFRSKWQIKKVGINITHLGALVLLAGGFITAKGAYEGIMLIPEGQSKNYFSDYHEVEFVVSQLTKGKNKVLAIAESELIPGAVIKLPQIAAEIKIVEFYENANMPSGQTNELIPLKTNPEAERNVKGLIVEFTGLDDGQDGRYAFEQRIEHPYNKELPRMINVEGKKVGLSLRKRRYYLPFDIYLEDLETKYYPGTQMAKNYTARLNLIKNKVSTERVVWMNNPLRSDGYTLYQSQVLGQEGEITGLAVVKNAGRWIPYISSCVICFGLLVHLIVFFPTLMQKAMKAKA